MLTSSSLRRVAATAAGRHRGRRRALLYSTTTSSSFNPVDVIVRKRDGHELSSDDIASFVAAYHRGDGSCADYQMSALLMAIFLNGMTNAETAALTLAMSRSGRVMDWSPSGDGAALPAGAALVDKHSTGGVGDKVSLVLAPLVASFGLRVPMMSGRGLGHTGGTLDKLEAIPGLRTQLDTDAFVAQLADARVRFAVFAPTADIAPVDKGMYALRDVSGSTESLPLIASSIMSKKIAENPAHGLVLDVKTGSGAFLRDFDASVALAEAMVAAGNGAGIPTEALLTSADQPLGRTVGNWLEAEEARVELLLSAVL